MLTAPKEFRGSWIDLYRDHIAHVLPRVDDVCRFHDWMAQYCAEPNPIFPLRAVTGTERRHFYSTADGTQIAPSDNSPAWVVHALLVERQLSSYEEFRHKMFAMPTHMFDIRKSIRLTANDHGWYVAHILPAKNRDTKFRLWDRNEVERRFYLTLHPCNVFFVPGVRNRVLGEDPNVIGFIADQYANRYPSIWGDFLRRVMGAPIIRDQDFGCTTVAFDLNGSAKAASRPYSGRSSRTQHPAETARVVVSYRATRLSFKRDYIEPLGAEEVFEVETPMGVYRFTKRIFYSEFPNIPQSASYREHGVYNGKTLHLKAHRFRVAD